MLVQVTQRDIEEGKPCSPCSCPLALAIGRAFEQPGVSVGASWVGVRGTSYPLPARAIEFRQAFDTDMEFARTIEMPFSFELGPDETEE